MINEHFSVYRGNLQGIAQIFKFQGQFDLEGQGHQFLNTSDIFRRSMNSLSIKAKFQVGQFKSLRQIFYKSI